MNARNAPNAPLSPVSVGGSDWSYPPMENDGPYPNNRGQLISPPNSGGSGPMNGFPPGPRSVGGPSPPPSVGRSSTATNLYARSESGRSQRDENQEVILGEHYVSLKRFLSATSRDGKPNPPPNKARDKLQRLTGVQFLELSTDVFDELKRREFASRRPQNANTNGPPPYLLPEDNFHPKRNQARQKLSSLGPPRFRDLATDVFCELERRYPRFVDGDIPRVGSPMSVRGPPSRSGTPVNGNGFPPRGPSRVRRPSEASSVRSGRGGPMNGGYGNSVPPSPGLPVADYGRPMAKQFQSNTIVPNKSTMVEEDDDPGSPTSPGPVNGFGANQIPNNRETKQSDISDRSLPSETDKKLAEEYEAQVRELRAKVDEMEDEMKKKQDEMNDAMNGERARATAANMEKKEWTDARLNMESQLAEAQNLNDSLQRELNRIRDEHANEARVLREQIEEARRSASSMSSNGPADPELARENQELRISLKEQQQVTDEVRREAQEFLREMRMLSQQSGSTWEKQAELEKTIETLESEVRDWRNRYARTKTQLRNMRASSLGLTIDQDAAKYVREKGFTQDNGLVKDVHVTKFQIAIDELLQRARVDTPEKAIDSMKAVVVSIRRITKDIDESAAPADEATMQQQAKLKGRVSSTANNLITATKNFAAGAGISPVSLLDAAASHLVAAVVELLRTVKIRTTPAGELEDDDDGTMTPVDSTGFFSPRSRAESQSQMSSAISTAISTQDSLPPPPPFQGLGGNRGSADSSAYSPISSPRESYSSRRPASRGAALTNGGMNGMAYMGLNKNLPNITNGGGYGAPQQQDARVEEFRIYLQDQSAVLVDTIQSLVQLIRNDADINQVTDEINLISDIVGKVVAESESFGPSGAALVERLASCRQRLMEAGDRGLDLAADGMDSKSREWRMWTQTLPPIAFEIAKETKGLVQRADELMNDGADDFA